MKALSIMTAVLFLTGVASAEGPAAGGAPATPPAMTDKPAVEKAAPAAEVKADGKKAKKMKKKHGETH